MKSFTLLNYLIFVSIISLFGFQSSKVLGKENSTQDSKAIISQRAVDLLAQNNSTSPVKITGVRINSTDKGIEVILETVNARNLQPVGKSQGNSLVADIANAVLSLPDGKDFKVENPAEGIASVTVTQVDANNIRLTVTGESSPPKAELFDSNQALIFVLTQNTSTAQTPQQPAPEQPTTENKPKPPSTENDEPIELIVTGQRDSYQVPNVTSGTRTDTPISDIPQSIQVIPRQVIEDKRANSVQETVDNVSGVTYLGDNDARGSRFTIRGFDDAPIVRDGTRVYGSSQGIPEIANVERVEVLKGPASILYGDIEPGGLINLVTKKPLAEPYYEAQLQVGNRGFIQPSFDISGPLSADGKLLYRLNALYRNEDSFRDYDSSLNRFFVAPTVTWQASKNTDITFNLEYKKDNNPADFGTVAFGDGIADIPLERVLNNPDETFERTELNIGYSLEHRFNDNWKLNNAFRYFKNKYEFSVLALPFGLNEDTGILTRFWAGQGQDQNDFSLNTNVEGKFNTGSIKHNLLFGVDLSRSTNKNQTRFDGSTPIPLDIFNPDYSAFTAPAEEDIPFFFDDKLKGDRLGIYLQDQIYFTDNLILLAGLRYDTIKQTIEDNLTDSEQTQNDDAFTPRVGIVYKPVDTVSLYASYSRSFNPNDTTDADGNFLKPEEGEGFEVGVKTELIKDKLSATLAYFDITKQNVATPDPVLPNFSVATGEQNSKGVELDVVGEISPGLKLIASYTYTDAEVTEDNNPDNIGSKLTGVPKHSASLWTTYEIQKGNLQGLGFGLGLKYVGARKGGLPNSFEVKDYLTTDAAIFYKKNNWRAALNFKNLFDIDYIEGVNTFRARNIYPGKPFTVIGSVSVEF